MHGKSKGSIQAFIGPAALGIKGRGTFGAEVDEGASLVYYYRIGGAGSPDAGMMSGRSSPGQVANLKGKLSSLEVGLINNSRPGGNHKITARARLLR